MRQEVVFDEKVAAHYEAWYETEKGRRADDLEKALLKKLLARVPRARSVLEIGCGTGHFSRWVDAQGLMTVGLDLSTAMLTEAKALDSTPLIRGNALRLPFADDAFDVAAFITTLEFLTRPRQALAEALRVAQHGIILGVLNRWSWLGLQRRLVGLFHPTLYNAAHFYGVQELKRLLASVAGERSHIVWRTAALGLPWPFRLPRYFSHIWPCGGFMGMALTLSSSTETKDER